MNIELLEKQPHTIFILSLQFARLLMGKVLVWYFYLYLLIYYCNIAFHYYGMYNYFCYNIIIIY